MLWEAEDGKEMMQNIYQKARCSFNGYTDARN